MKKVTLSMLIFLMFVNQIMYVFGNISILSEPVNSTGYRKLICVSKDDDSALVWVNKSDYNYIIKSSNQIYSSNRHINNEIDCKMNMYEECLESWNKSEWSFTSSLDTPMGPVFDERWQDFTEYEMNNGNEYESIDIDTTTIVFSFLRYKMLDWHILFCDRTIDTSVHYCHRLRIGEYNDGHNSYIIDSCLGIADEDNLFIKNTELDCHFKLKHKGKRNSNWQTSTIIWDPITRKISLYNTDDGEMTYEEIQKIEGFMINNDIFIGSVSSRNTSGMIRFHIYDFLHTTFEGAILTSPTFAVYTETICINMLLGLCAECDANIKLLNSANNEVLKTVTIKGSAAKHGLPMWQSVEIKENLTTTYYINVTIQLIPKLNAHTFNPSLWAIANVRQCPQNGTLKAVVVHEKVDEKNVQHSLVGCQKLFYDEQTYLPSWSNLTIGLEKLNVPKVIFVNKTSIRVVLPTTWNAMSYYKEIPISYFFEIREPETHSVQQSRKKIFRNTTQLIEQFENLKPDTEYEIRCTLIIAGYSRHSDWITVCTHCDNKSTTIFKIYNIVLFLVYIGITCYILRCIYLSN